MIQAVYESGYSGTVYSIFIILLFIGVFAFNSWYSDKYNITKKQAAVASIAILFLTYAWIYLLSWAETGFQVFGGKALVRGLVYIPVFAYPIARKLKIDWVRMCDFFAPCGCVAQAINKIGCIFAGCCHGYPCDFGIYNPVFGKTTFPCQPLEGIVYLLAAVLVVLYSKRKKYHPDGRSFALMLILYGSARFLLEFARNNRKILLGCSPTALHALFMAIVGYIAFICIAEKKEREAKKKRAPRHKKPTKAQ